jgi:hypothetical protein
MSVPMCKASAQWLKEVSLCFSRFSCAAALRGKISPHARHSYAHSARLILQPDSPRHSSMVLYTWAG